MADEQTEDQVGVLGMYGVQQWIFLQLDTKTAVQFQLPDLLAWAAIERNDIR